jgi:hypothetical protein
MGLGETSRFGCLGDGYEWTETIFRARRKREIWCEFRIGFGDRHILLSKPFHRLGHYRRAAELDIRGLLRAIWRLIT